MVSSRRRSSRNLWLTVGVCCSLFGSPALARQDAASCRSTVLDRAQFSQLTLYDQGVAAEVLKDMNKPGALTSVLKVIDCVQGVYVVLYKGKVRSVTKSDVVPAGGAYEDKPCDRPEVRGATNGATSGQNCRKAGNQP